MATEKMTYHDRIVRDPEILAGKPTIKGTRIPVDLVLAHLARNPNVGDLFADYPRLTMEDVRACLAFASELVQREGWYPPTPAHTTSPDTVAARFYEELVQRPDVRELLQRLAQE
jgi:uncharacterized protein (DUF433 family)